MMLSIIKNKIIPILLCGGSGSRLWPMSRESFPKQYLNCNPSSKYSFLQETQNRLRRIKNIEPPIVICNEEHRFIVAEQLREIGVNPQAIILEPCGRNTAPAITLASIKALEKEEDPILLALPADHSIIDVDNFLETIERGLYWADKGEIITFGVPPHSAETGYGYIEGKSAIDFANKKAIRIKRFIEKPNKSKAQELILDKRYVWNSGIFLLKAKTAINQIKKFEYEIYDICNKALKDSNKDLDFVRLNKEIFENCTSKSFDIAVMEKTKIGSVLPLKSGWSDVGSWDSLWNICDKDENDNVLVGDIFLEKTSNCYLRGENKLVVGLGLSNLIVVDTYDALLVANKELSQDIKGIVSKLMDKKYDEAKVHKKIFRPWGHYLSIGEGNRWQVKRIIVNPGAALSLQKHQYRAEHWIVVSGVAEVEVGEEKKMLKENQSTYIPLGYKHRLSNPGKDNLILIEVQSGSYLGEDDIYRFEDNYGRN